jgi:hypothetical protein
MTQEQYFLNYVKEISPIYGVFGKRAYLGENGQYVKDDLKFLTLDETFRVTYERDPYVKGNFPNVIRKKIDNIKKIRLEKNHDSLIRTDNDVERLIHSIYISASINQKNKTKEDSSSEEFKYFSFLCGLYSYCNTRIIFEDGIPYEDHTDIGKKSIEDAKVFFENNTSKTPIQDALNKVLEKNGLPTHEPYDKWCELPIMQKIDYTTKEELEGKRKGKSDDIKMTPELKTAIEKLKKKLHNENN